MKEKYLWALGGLIVGAMFGSRIPLINKLHG